MIGDNYKIEYHSTDGESKSADFDYETDFFQSLVETANQVISSAKQHFKDNSFDNYFQVLESLITFFDAIYKEQLPIDTIFPHIYDLEFNFFLIQSIDPNTFSIQNINISLNLISLFSSFDPNFLFFKDSNIFGQIFALLQLNEPILFRECIIILNQYFSIFENQHFSFNIDEFLSLFDHLSSLPIISKYITETLFLLLKYVEIDNSRLPRIFHLLNLILPQIDSRHGIDDILKSLFLVIQSQPKNFSIIFDSQILNTFLNQIQWKFVHNQERYGVIIESFLKFLNIALKKMDHDYQIRTRALISITTLFELFQSIHCEKVHLQIFNLLYQYFQFDIQQIYFDVNDEESHLFSLILNSGLIEYLLDNFSDYAFDMKTMIIKIFDNMLITENQELFRQLMHRDIESNYLSISIGFARGSDDINIQKMAVHSILKLLNIGQKLDELGLICESESVAEFIEYCLSSEDTDVVDMAQEYYNQTTLE